jgi:hypothetical protein
MTFTERSLLFAVALGVLLLLSVPERLVYVVLDRKEQALLEDVGADDLDDLFPPLEGEL